MPLNEIRFNDGDAYERYMGVWSRTIGGSFLDWLTPAHGQHWLDVGCGNGVFSELLMDRCAPSRITGIDPSEEQLRFARSRPVSRIAHFVAGDAMALPFSDNTFDTSVMPLVLFFVRDPLKGLSEMMRVVRPGGVVSAYCWDLPNGGSPYHILQSTLREMGKNVPEPPSPEIARRDVLERLWKDGNAHDVSSTTIVAERIYRSLDEYWEIVRNGPSTRPAIASLSPEEIDRLKIMLRERLTFDATGRIIATGTANAVRGIVG